jgi:hypothetical protein
LDGFLALAFLLVVDLMDDDAILLFGDLGEELLDLGLGEDLLGGVEVGRLVLGVHGEWRPWFTG